MIYFTSDLHLSHKNIIRYNNRPFRDEIHMNNQIINNINSIVKQNDQLYILGDFAFCNKQDTNKLLDKIRCKKYLIKGNHDGFIKDKSNIELHVEWVKQYHELKYNGYSFILFHYPILVWNKKHHGAIHLYGHCHSEQKERQIPHEYMKNSWNVNCEFWNFKPVPITYFIDHFNPEANKIN